MEKDNIMIIAIVAIVAIVALVFMMSNFGGKQYVASENSYAVEADLAGQAIKPMTRQPISLFEYASILDATLHNSDDGLGMISENEMQFYVYSGDVACKDISRTCLKIEEFDTMNLVWRATNIQCSDVADNLQGASVSYLIDLIDVASEMQSTYHGDVVLVNYRAVCDSKRLPLPR